MQLHEKNLSSMQIRTLNISENDVLGKDYQWDRYNGSVNYITVNGKRIAGFVGDFGARAMIKTWNKIRKMNLGWGWKAPIQSDEEAGIIQAVEIGENPFACTIMCSNPKLNEIVR
jgi:hypothetical protein